MKATLQRNDGSTLLVEGTPTEISEIFALGASSQKATPPKPQEPRELSVKTVAQPTPGKRAVSAETRAKIAAAQSKRWAAARAAEKPVKAKKAKAKK